MLEAIFIQKYGEEYKAYMRETSYFIPLPPKKTSL
jgi:protein-S-isoprenylcysteine O-methyltransferase Ste14